VELFGDKGNVGAGFNQVAALEILRHPGAYVDRVPTDKDAVAIFHRPGIYLALVFAALKIVPSISTELRLLNVMRDVNMVHAIKPAPPDDIGLVRMNYVLNNHPKWR